jgi:hypothetical protein
MNNRLVVAFLAFSITVTWFCWLCYWLPQVYGVRWVFLP